jgi:benzoate/toluate 1,2-dioxygenase reductase subunit
MSAAVRSEVRLLSRTPVGEGAIEIAFSRPEGFQFIPGQSIRLREGASERDYSIASGPADPRLVILVRLVEHGELTPLLASAAPGRIFLMYGPHGFFTFQAAGPFPPVFVATGTGAAPFLSMVRAGARDFTMLHGVRRPDDLAHPQELRAAAAQFVPCVSGMAAGGASAGLAEGWFSGRVTEWVRKRLPPGAYDFYLCGRRDMIGEMELIIDEKFPGSLVHTETFF